MFGDRVCSIFEKLSSIMFMCIMFMVFHGFLVVPEGLDAIHGACLASAVVVVLSHEGGGWRPSSS